MPTIEANFRYKEFLGKIRKNYREKVQKELPKIIAQEAKDFFTENFAKEGWEDNGFQKWAEPNRKKEGTRERKKTKKQGGK